MYLSIYLPVCLPACLSVSPSIYLSIFNTLWLLSVISWRFEAVLSKATATPVFLLLYTYVRLLLFFPRLCTGYHAFFFFFSSFFLFSFFNSQFLHLLVLFVSTVSFSLSFSSSFSSRVFLFVVVACVFFHGCFCSPSFIQSISAFVAHTSLPSARSLKWFSPLSLHKGVLFITSVSLVPFCFRQPPTSNWHKIN